MAVSHIGVKLLRREKSLPTDYLKVRIRIGREERDRKKRDRKG